MDSTTNFSLGSILNNPELNVLNILSSINNISQYDFLDTNDFDSHYCNAKFSCKYFHDNEFTAQYSGDKRFAILSLNIQSLMSKFSDFKGLDLRPE